MSLSEEFKDKISFVGLLVSILSLIVFLGIVSKGSFDLTSFARFGSEFVKADSNVGQSTSRYLWTNRTLDVVIQATLVFGAAAGCIAMLRSEKESDKV